MRKIQIILILFILITGFTNIVEAQTGPRDINKKYQPDPSGYKYGQPTIDNLPGVKGARYPSLSPDGTLVSFTYHGDIWTMPSTGGRATKITNHRAYDICSRFSPDGTKLAFGSNRGHGFDVYTVPVSGGTPTKITQHNFPDFMGNWTADGNLVVVSSRSLKYQIWHVNPNGGTPKMLTKHGALDGSLSPDKRFLVYSFGTADSTRRNYHGTGNWDLYLLDLQSGSDIPQKLTDTDYNEYDPYFSADGKFIFYRAEVNGTYEIFRLILDGKSQPEQITKFEKGTGVDELFYDSKNKVLLFAREFYLFKLDLTKEKLAIEHMPAIVESDPTGNDTIKRTYTKGHEDGDISADGKLMVFTLKGDIWVMSAQGGVAQQLTKTPWEEHWPRWSPDGTKIAYYCNASGNDDLYYIDLNVMKSYQLTKNPGGDFFHNWSPDGKHIVFSSDRTGDKEIYLIAMDETRKETQLTNSPGPDDDPCFTPDGKSIVFDSGRAGVQGIYIMDVNGENQKALYNSANFDQLPRVSPDGKFVVFESIVEGSPASIMIMGINGNLAMQVLAEGNAPYFTPDGESIIYSKYQIVKNRLGAREIERTMLKIKAPKEIRVGVEIPMIANVTTSVKEDNLRVFNEAWQTLKDSFYDKDMHGVDWDALKQKYLPLVLAAESKQEVFNLTNRMIGELGASHMGHNGYTEFSSPQSQTGYLGIDGEMVQTARGYAYRINSVINNSPADLVWLRPGDHIFSIGNYRFNAKTNFFQLLDKTVGLEITMLVTPGMEFDHGRFVKIKPVGYMDIYNINYANWLRNRTLLVRNQTRGLIAYVHLTMMDKENLEKFMQTVVMANAYGQRALIIDCRNNGGGRIHDELLDVLTRKPYGYETNRERKLRRPAVYWDKPVVVLVNERSFSDAELFPAAFQMVKRGLVIGVNSPGDVIGTHDIMLSDGSSLRVPGWGWYDLRGRNLEGKGVTPDITVKMTQEDIKNNRDPQLAKACEVLLKQLFPPKPKVEKPAEKTPQTQPDKKETPQTQPNKDE